MSKNSQNASNKKKEGKGNGNSVINNTEKFSNYVSGESTSSSGKKFSSNNAVKGSEK